MTINKAIIIIKTKIIQNNFVVVRLYGDQFEYNLFSLVL